MVITFPKQSEAMVTLFHGEGNFPLLFWYTLTKPSELQDISVNLLNVVFYSVKRNINESIWRWEYCCCSLQCSYYVTCWSSYVNWASAGKIWTILHTDSYVIVFVVCQLSWEVLKVVPWTFHLKQLMKFEEIWIMGWLELYSITMHYNLVMHHLIEFGVHEWLFATVYMIYVREWGKSL